jgi:hypothetical protein
MKSMCASLRSQENSEDSQIARSATKWMADLELVEKEHCGHNPATSGGRETVVRPSQCKGERE